MDTSSELQHIQTQLATQRPHLVELYQRVLRETLFTSRGQVRPASLKGIAAAEAEAVLDFFYNPDPARGRLRGSQLCHTGLGEETVLRLGQTTRQFCLTHLPQTLFTPALDLAESYHSAVMGGFVETHVAVVLEEQERIRTAVQRALSRAAVQMEAAADIAQAATSILDLNELLNTSVELIRARFDFYYVGIFLVDEYGGWAVLRAGSGEAGQEMLRRAHRLEVGGDSMIGRCVAHGQPRIAQDVGLETIRFDNPLLPETHSEMALPLTSRDKVIGAMTIQSSRVAAFSEQDIAALRVLTDQLANAIENSRLFAEVQASLTEVQAAQSRYVRESWPETTRPVLGYLYEQSTDDFSPADKLQRPEMEQALQRGRLVTPFADDAPSSQAALAVPITLRGEVIGVLDLYDVTEARQWSDDDVELVSEVLSQAALTIDNARLFEETARRAHETAVIQQITSTINVSENLITDLSAIAQALRKLVPLDDLSLATYTSGELEFTLFTLDVEITDGSFAAQGTRQPLKDSGPGWVITHQKPWLEADMRLQRTFGEDAQLVARGSVSRLLLPLKVSERLVGTLNMFSNQPSAFTQEHLPTLNQITDQMALALERVRLLEETQTALAEVEATHRRYLREEWESILAATARTWGYADSPEGLVAIEEIWTPEIEQAVATGKPVTWTGSADGDGRSRRNALALPIRLRGQTIGVLDFYDEERVWTEDDKVLAQALAVQVALALENARLFEQTERRAHRERLTGEIAGKIRAAGDVHSILETAAEELARALGVSRTLIRLGNPNGGVESVNGDDEGNSQYFRK